MNIGETIVKHFDLVTYILKKHRTMMITEIADVFMIDLVTVREVYEVLGIDPLIIVIKNYKGEVVPDSENEIKPQNESVHAKRYMHIIPSKRKPNREPLLKKFERPPAKYTNISSPYGIASELHNDNLDDKTNQDADNKTDI